MTVALGGDGGDELFAGYPTYLAHRVAKQYERWCRLFHPAISFIGNLLPVSDDNISFDFKVKKFLSGIGYAAGVRNAIWLGSFSFSELKKVLSGDVGNHVDPSRVEEDITSYARDIPSKMRRPCSVPGPEALSPGGDPGEGGPGKYGLFPGNESPSSRLRIR